MQNPAILDNTLVEQLMALRVLAAYDVARFLISLNSQL
jgi:hypothetical protein